MWQIERHLGEGMKYTKWFTIAEGHAWSLDLCVIYKSTMQKQKKILKKF